MIETNHLCTLFGVLALSKKVDEEYSCCTATSMGFEPIERRLRPFLLCRLLGPRHVQWTIVGIELASLPKVDEQVYERVESEATTPVNIDTKRLRSPHHRRPPCISWETSFPVFLPRPHLARARLQIQEMTGFWSVRGVEYFERVYAARFNSVFERGQLHLRRRSVHARYMFFREHPRRCLRGTRTFAHFTSLIAFDAITNRSFELWGEVDRDDVLAVPIRSCWDEIRRLEACRRLPDASWRRRALSLLLHHRVGTHPMPRLVDDVARSRDIVTNSSL